MTNPYILSLIHKYRATDLVVDTNLLILYAVGNHDPNLINKFKRTAHFRIEDFYTLKLFLGYFRSVLTTPNILTEVSNLSASLDIQLHHQFFPSFQEMILTLTEKYIDSKVASELPVFEKFGLTDSVIAELGCDGCLVLTDDFPLSNYLQKLKIDVVNFNHIRSEQWLR